MCKRDLYDWWKRKIMIGASVGHRYHCLFCLSVYAIKCNIDEEELTSDIYSYLERFDSISDSEDNRFTEKDVIDALQAYWDRDLVTYPIGSIAYNSGIPIERNKRNFRKQNQHLKIARFARDLNYDDSTGWINKEGAPKKQSVVQNWRVEHPSGTPKECIAETGLSKNTVYKWW